MSSISIVNKILFRGNKMIAKISFRSIMYIYKNVDEIYYYKKGAKMNKIKSMIVLLIIMCFLFAACLGSTPGPTKTNEEKAVEKVVEAKSAMESKDYEGAMNLYSEAAVLDSKNDDAAIGYAFLNLLSLMADEDVVALAKNDLGFKDYPTTMSQAVMPTSWLIYEEVILDSENQTEIYIPFFPAIKGEEKFVPNEGDKVTNFIRLSAFIDYTSKKNFGCESFSAGLDKVLGEKLDLAVLAVNNLSNTMKFQLTEKMLEDPEFAGFPPGIDEILLGKVELQGLVAKLQMLAAFCNIIECYNTTINIEDIADVMMNGDSYTIGDFGILTENAEVEFSKAKVDLKNAVSSYSALIEGILSNRSGFALSADGPFVTGEEQWNSLLNQCRLGLRLMNEIDNSLVNDVNAYIPRYIEKPEDWPTDSSNAMTINLGKLFSAPTAIFSGEDGNGLIRLASDEDPIFYYKNGDSYEKIVDTSVFYYDSTNSYFELSEDKTPALNCRSMIYIPIYWGTSSDLIIPGFDFNESLGAIFIPFDIDILRVWASVASEGETARYSYIYQIADSNEDFIGINSLISNGTFWNSLRITEN